MRLPNAASRSLQPVANSRLTSQNHKYTGSSLSQSEIRMEKRNIELGPKMALNYSNVQEKLFCEPDDKNLLSIQSKMSETLEEFVKNFISIDAVETEISKIENSYRWCISREICNYTLDKNDKYKNAASEIFVHLIRNSRQITLDQFKHGFKQIFDSAQDICIDIPLFWSYVSTILGKYNKLIMNSYLIRLIDFQI